MLSLISRIVPEVNSSRVNIVRQSVLSIALLLRHVLTRVVSDGHIHLLRTRDVLKTVSYLECTGT